MITLYWYLEDIDGNTAVVGSYGECIAGRNELAATYHAEGWEIRYRDRKRIMHATKDTLIRKWKLVRVQLPSTSL